MSYEIIRCGSIRRCDWLLRHRRPLWFKVYALKDVGSASTSVGLATGIMRPLLEESAATEQLDD